MKPLAIRILTYSGGLLLILALTATHFDYTEWVTCAMFAGLVAAVEVCLRETKNGGHYK